MIGWKDIVLDKQKKTVWVKRKGMAITLGGIAKGYAVDKCVAMLKAKGFTDFMVQAGGDMYVAGNFDRAEASGIYQLVASDRDDPKSGSPLQPVPLTGNATTLRQSNEAAYSIIMDLPHATAVSHVCLTQPHCAGGQLPPPAVH